MRRLRFERRANHEIIRCSRLPRPRSVDLPDRETKGASNSGWTIELAGNAVSAATVKSLQEIDAAQARAEEKAAAEEKEQYDGQSPAVQLVLEIL